MLKKYPYNSNLSLASFNLQLQAIVFVCCSYFLRERKVCVQLLPFHILHGITNAKHTLTFTPSTPHHPRPTLPTYWQARPSRALTKNVLQLQVALSAKYSNGIFFILLYFYVCVRVLMMCSTASLCLCHIEPLLCIFVDKTFNLCQKLFTRNFNIPFCVHTHTHTLIHIYMYVWYILM